MAASELSARIRNLEDGLTERKRGMQSADEIRKAAVSFANSVPEGHTAALFIGITNEGVVSGVSVDEAEKIQRQVRRVCQEDCFPPIAIRLAEVIPIEGTYVVGFEFAHSPNRPHFTGHAYIRVGSESVKASASKFDELIASRNTKAGRLIAAKEGGEHVTLFLPARSSMPGQSPLARPRDLECVVHECDAQHAKFYDVADRSIIALPLEHLSLSWDRRHDRAMVEYTRLYGTVLMAQVRE